jgi:hypothetical protein
MRRVNAGAGPTRCGAPEQGLIDVAALEQENR